MKLKRLSSALADSRPTVALPLHTFGKTLAVYGTAGRPTCIRLSESRVCPYIRLYQVYYVVHPGLDGPSSSSVVLSEIVGRTSRTV